MKARRSLDNMSVISKGNLEPSSYSDCNLYPFLIAGNLQPVLHGSLFLIKNYETKNTKQEFYILLVQTNMRYCPFNTSYFFEVVVTLITEA